MSKRKSASHRDHSSETPGWFSGLRPGTQDLLSIVLLYGVALLLFRGVVFENRTFTAEGDAANHLSYKQAGDMIMEKEGVDALWSPYVFSGMPTFGNVSYIPHNVSYIEAACLAVVRTIFLGGTSSGFVAFFFLGGVFMFFLMRSWEFPRAAALIAALTFMLSPYAIGLGEAGHGSKLKALMYLPLIVLLTHVLFHRRDLLSFGLLSAGIGTLLLTNHVQIVYYVLIVLGLYVVYWLVVNWREHRAASLTTPVVFAAALIVGLAISSYIYLSVYEFSTFSIRGGGTAGSEGGLTWDYATNWSMRPVELVTLLIPSFFGFRSPYYWGSMPFTGSTVYVGLVPVFLAVVALFYARKRLAVFFFVLTVIILLMSFGKHLAFLYELLFSYLPFFNKFRAPSTILHLLPFALGVLGGYGFTALMEKTSGPEAQKLKRTLTIILVVVGSFLVIGALTRTSIFAALSDSMFVKEGELQIYQQQYGARAPQIIDQLKQIRFFGNDQNSGLWGDYVRFSLLTLVMLGLTIALCGRMIRKGLYSGSMIALVIIDLWIIDAKFINPVPETSVENRFRPDQTISFLKQQPGLFRVFPIGDLFMDNTFAFHEIQSIGGYSPAKLKIYQTVVDSCLYRGADPAFPINMNVVNMLNVRYFVASARLPQDRFPLVHVDEARKKLTYENPGALPRAFFVEEAVTARGDSEVFRIINSSGFDASRVAVVQTEAPPAVTAPDSAKADVTEFRSRFIGIDAYTSSPALLVLSEVYYPAGWHATIDGAPAEILRTNSILRSVVVPAGSHRIEFSLDPASYQAGWTISHAAWAITVLCIVAGLWRNPSVRKKLQGFIRTSGKPE
jgi:hypothetical protein